MSSVSLLNFLCSRTFISIVNFVIRSWFFFCCLCLNQWHFWFFFDFKKFCEWKLIICVVFINEKERNWNWKKKLSLFFVLLLAFSSIHRLKTYLLLSFLFLNWIFRFCLFRRLLFWIQKNANLFKKKKRSFLMKSLS